MEKPRLLNTIDAFPVNVEGQDMIALRNPRLESEEALLLPPQLFFIVSLFDGRNTIRDIQYLYVRKFGHLIRTDQIEKMIEQLDDKLLLDSPRHQEHLEELRQQYRDLPSRPAMHQGKSYPAEVEELHALFTSFFSDPKGPGLLDEQKRLPPPIGIVAPHIDFNRGGPCFAHAYKTIGEAQDVDLFIILGTDHDATNNFYSLSSKDYDTPFGLARRDEHFVNTLCSRVEFDLFEDELNHRREHSIEFQALFLKWLYRNRPDITIVPILCGTFHQLILEEKNPAEDEQIQNFLEALSTGLQEYEGTACIIAGVDFSHVGLHFGAPNAPSPEDLEDIARSDKELLNSMTCLDYEGFYDQISSRKNNTNVCGVSPIYTLMSLLQSATGTILDYDYWHDEKEGSMVSFASMVYH